MSAWLPSVVGLGAGGFLLMQSSQIKGVRESGVRVRGVEIKGQGSGSREGSGSGVEKEVG